MNIIFHKPVCQQPLHLHNKTCGFESVQHCHRTLVPRKIYLAINQLYYDVITTTAARSPSASGGGGSSMPQPRLISLRDRNFCSCFHHLKIFTPIHLHITSINQLHDCSSIMDVSAFSFHYSILLFG